jgi:hypothetical protein
MPSSASSRPIPFALTDQVRDQLQIMLKDGIKEESFLAYINPLTLVVREAKPLRICMDARKINRQMIADRTKVLPLRELIQKFHGAMYITSLDLSSAFLQVPLKETSRQWTAFQFQGKVYQLKTVLYGFKNSLSAFIRALGNDKINDNMVMYVDDLLIHSSTFTEHLEHINAVLHKLTTAGFTIKTQPMSDAVRGITSKFMYIYEGPFWISKILDHSAYELKDECGKVRGEFNKRQLKPYREERENQEGEEK